MEQSALESKKSIQFWTLLNPFIFSLTFLVLLLKSSGDYLLPSFGILGLLVCWKWRIRGLAVSLGALLALIGYRFFYGTTPDFWWEAAIAFSFSLSFVASALGFDEIEAQIASLCPAALPAKQEDVANVEALEAENKRLLELFEVARVEALELTHRQEQLMRDLFDSRAVVNKLQEDKKFIGEEVERLRTALRETEQQQDASAANEQLENERQQLQQAYEKLFEEFTLQQSVALETSEHIETLEREKDLLETTLSRLQHEFERKEADLHKAELSCKNLAAKLESASKHDSAYLAKTEQLEHEIQELRQKLQIAYSQQNEYQNKITTLHRLSDQFLDLQMRCETMTNERERLRLAVAELSSVPRDARIANGKYEQLRLQFEEKCAALDQARKDLFAATEALEAAKLELEEQRLQASSDEAVQRVLAQSDLEIQALEASYRQEIEQLHSLIRSLSS